MELLNLKFRWRIPVLFQFLSGLGDAETESLYVAQVLHGFGEIAVSVVVGTGAAKVLPGYAAKGPAGILNFHPVGKLGNPDRGVGALVTAMHDRVSSNLL